MKDPLQMLSEDRNIDAQFRNILASRLGGTFAMTAEGESSQITLQTAADILCGTDAERKMLQMVYDLAVMDGQLKAKREQLAKMAGAV